MQMELSELSLIIRLIIGAITTLFAIILWAKTRDTAWICVVIGIILSYVEIIFTTFRRLGILTAEVFLIWGLPGLDIIQIMLINAPLLFFIMAFIIVILRNKSP
jgi:hypothetical protein